jgi:hypothetical protein
MSLHTYTRVKKPGGWDINNVDHIDADGKQITLASEVEVAFPGKSFKVCNEGTECKVIFTTTLTPLEVTALDSVVSSHKAITSIQRYKNKKIAAIDERTGELIRMGFSYGGKIFSLSDNAQRKMIGTHEVKDHPALVYPVEWNTKDDLDSVLLSNAAELDAFYLTGLGTMRAHIDSGTTLKRDVRSATTLAEVQAVVDAR